MPGQKLDHNLPALAEQYSLASYTPAAPFELEPEEPSVPLSHYLWIVRRHRWKILSFILTCVIATVIISSRLTPAYEATVTIDIDRQTPTGVIGQEAMRSVTNDAEQFLATQIKLIQSDSVLRPVAQKYDLLELGIPGL
jgi:succinoglycan biosynthesis transport protein ExoP